MLADPEFATERTASLDKVGHRWEDFSGGAGTEWASVRVLAAGSDPRAEYRNLRDRVEAILADEGAPVLDRRAEESRCAWDLARDDRQARLILGLEQDRGRSSLSLSYAESIPPAPSGHEGGVRALPWITAALLLGAYAALVLFRRPAPRA